MYIPKHIRENIIIEAIILNRRKKGWNHIHYDITCGNLYLKKTKYIFHETFFFEKINRLNHFMNFCKKKKYTWLKKYQNAYQTYYYEPPRYYEIQDIFEMDHIGVYFNIE